MDLAAAYGDFWPADIIAAYLTPWSPVPVNFADERALGDALLARTGDTRTSARVSLAVRESRSAGLKLGAFDLELASAERWDDIAGLFTTEAPVNVNEVPREILYGLLLWSGQTQARARDSTDSIASLRSLRTLEASEIPGLAGVGATDPLLSLLGDRTLAWEIRVEAGDEALIVHCLRVFQRGSAGVDLFSDASGKATLRVIDRRWVGRGAGA